MSKNLLGTLLALAGLLAVPARANVIPGLFNTGLDAGGALLVGGNGVLDVHYTVISGPATGSGVTFQCCYFADGPNSRWISVNASGGPSAGLYDFRTTFSLAGLNPATAQIVGQFAADNLITDILLNGSSTGQTAPGFGSFVPYAIPAGSPFVTGTNTLDFMVVDQGSPMSFRNEMSGTADPAAQAGVPEPATAGLLGGALGLAWLLRKAQRQSPTATKPAQ